MYISWKYLPRERLYYVGGGRIYNGSPLSAVYGEMALRSTSYLLALFYLQTMVSILKVDIYYNCGLTVSELKILIS